MRRKPGKQSKQNKPTRNAMDSFASRPNTRRGVPVRGNVRTHQVVAKHGKAKVVSQHPINWMLIGIICAGLVLAAGIGYLVYMNTSDSGQRMTARKRTVSANEAMLTLASSTDAIQETARDEVLKDFNDAPAQAYWLVGQEYMDMGDMQDAIMAFRIADIIDPENNFRFGMHEGADAAVRQRGLVSGVHGATLIGEKGCHLAVAGGVVLAALVAHSAWTARRNAPKLPQPGSTAACNSVAKYRS